MARIAGCAACTRLGSTLEATNRSCAPVEREHVPCRSTFLGDQHGGRCTSLASMRRPTSRSDVPLAGLRCGRARVGMSHHVCDAFGLPQLAMSRPASCRSSQPPRPAGVARRRASTSIAQLPRQARSPVDSVGGQRHRNARARRRTADDRRTGALSGRAQRCSAPSVAPSASPTFRRIDGTAAERHIEADPSAAQYPAGHDLSAVLVEAREFSGRASTRRSSGDDELVPVLERSHVRPVLEVSLPEESAGTTAAISVDINTRTAPIYRILVSAASSDTDAAAILDELTRQRQERPGTRRHGAGPSEGTAARHARTGRRRRDSRPRVPRVYHLLVIDRAGLRTRGPWSRPCELAIGTDRIALPPAARRVDGVDRRRSRCHRLAPGRVGEKRCRSRLTSPSPRCRPVGFPPVLRR